MTEDSPFTRLGFLGIDDQNRQEFVTVWKFLEPERPAVMQGFYEQIDAFSGMKAMVGLEQDCLVKRQTEHWARLFSGPFDETDVDGIRRIARAHHKIGLGVAGRGFAVVAQEVKALAEQTAVTNEIASKVQETANATRDVATSVEKLDAITSSVAGAADETDEARSVVGAELERLRTDISGFLSVAASA